MKPYQGMLMLLGDQSYELVIFFHLIDVAILHIGPNY
jgi:hypothetical protein